MNRDFQLILKSKAELSKAVNYYQFKPFSYEAHPALQTIKLQQLFFNMIHPIAVFLARVSLL